MTEPADVGDRRIEAQGTSETEWQRWDGLDRVSTVDAASLVPARHRLVIVAPHPDDEILGAGGLMAMLAAMHREILVIGVTDGSGSHPGSTIRPPARLVAERRIERSTGLARLGATTAATVELGFADGSLAAQHEALVRSLHTQLRHGDVVFATWRSDGHPDHEAVGRAAAEACRNCGARLIEMPVWTWHWARPADTRVPWQTAVRVEIGDVLARKRAAIQCHVSQLQADTSTGNPPILPQAALRRWLRTFEVFFV